MIPVEGPDAGLDPDESRRCEIARLQRELRVLQSGDGLRWEETLDDGLSLEASEAIYVDNPDGVLFTNPNGDVLAANPAACEILRLSEAEICALGRTGLSDHSDPRWEQLLSERQRTGRVAGIARMLRGDGTKVEVEISAQVFSDANGGQRSCAILRDVTERVRLQAELAAAQELLRGAFEHAPIGMALVSPDGRFLRVNDALCEIVGYERVDLLSRTFQEITHPDDLDADLGHVRELLAGDRRGYRMEKRYFHRSGDVVWIKLSVTLVRDDHEQPLHFIAQIEDITAAKANEDALRRSEARLRAVIDNAPASIVLRGLDGRYELVNAGVAEALGMAAEELVGRSPAEFLEEGAIESIRQADARLIAGGVPTVEEVELAHADGVSHVHHIVRYPITDADGTLKGLGSFAIDITERKRIERALQERERQLEDAQTLARFGSFELDLATGALWWSDELCRIFGRPPGDSPTLQKFMDQVHPDDLAAFQQNTALARRGQFTDSEFRIIRPDGEIRHVYTRRFGRPDADGALTQIWGTTQDVTERREAELALAASEERYRAVVEQLPGSVVTLVDTDLRVQWLGGRVVHDAKLDQEQILGRTVRETSGGGEHGEMIEGLYARALRGETVSTEISSLVTHRDFGLEIAPLHGPDGAVTGALSVAQDITERREREAELEREHRDLNQAQAIAAVGSWDYDERADPTTRWSPQLWTMLDVEPRQAGPGIEEFMSMVRAADRKRVLDAMTEASSTGQAWNAEFGMVAADRRELIVSLHAEPTRDDDGRVVRSSGTIQDITDRAQRDAEERALRRIAELVAGNAGSAAVFAAVAAEVQRLFGAHTGVLSRYDPTAGVGTILSGQRADGKATPQLTFERGGNTASAAVVRTGRAARIDTEAPIGDITQTDEWMADNHITAGVAAPVIVAGQLWGTISAAFTGVTIPANAEQRLARFARLTSMAIANADAWDVLSRQASTDAITSLANHRTFQHRLRAEVTRARRYRRHLSLVLLDIDHFKRVNDTYGHQAGDRVLAELGRRMSSAARDGELVARIGGEEFAWLLPETDPDGAFQAAERIRRIVEAEPFAGVGTITVSAGVCASEPGLDSDDLVRFADRALYWAKDGGRNTTFLYTDEAHAMLSEQTGNVERFQTMSSVRDSPARFNPRTQPPAGA